MGDELKQLKTFHIQLLKMVDYFNRKKQTEFLAEDLDEIRASISRKIGNLEGWYTGRDYFD